MPIVGLTDAVQPRLPDLGVLRKGGAKRMGRNGKEIFGEDLSFFRMTSDRPEVEKVFIERYGAQPASLRVYLQGETIEQNWSAWKEDWQAGGLIHRCDGKTCTIYLDKASGKYIKNDPKPCPGNCKEVGRLRLILPELWAAGHVGLVTLLTHSLHDIMHIQSVLEAVYQARVDSRSRGGLTGVEFTLSRRQEEISTPGEDGKRVMRKKWLVKLEPSADWVSLQLEMAKRNASRMLPDKVGVDDFDARQGHYELEEQDDDYEDEPDGEQSGEVDIQTGEVITPQVKVTERQQTTLKLNGAQ